jgi:DNA polymerase-4
LYQFTDLIEPYSIDEQFLDVTGSYHLWQDYWTLSRRIQEKIKCEIGVFARIGISHNKVLAKMACDIFAKKRADGLFELKEEDIATHLWPQPINKMFGVGHRLTYHLQHLGVRTIGDLANYPLDRLKKRWGINGHILWLTANGYDNSPVCPQSPAPKSIGHQMTLPKDYEQLEDIQVILLELSEEVGRRARKHRYVAQTVSLGCRGGNFDLPQGFYHQQTLTYSTNATLPLYKACCDMLYRFWAGYPIRSLSITLSQLFSSDEYQLNLFHNQDKDERLHQAIDKLNERFGVATIIRATSLTEAGQAKIRAKKIGGHFL